jgi:myeloid leukemia factor 1
MFGFPTDLFGIRGGNNGRSNSNALVPQHHSLFDNSLMMPSPFAGVNGVFNDFGIVSSPFAMMDRMIRATNDPLFFASNNNTNAPVHSFTSTTVMSYSGTDGRPKVYQESTSHSRGPGGLEETRQAVRDSERGINKVRTVLESYRFLSDSYFEHFSDFQ